MVGEDNANILYDLTEHLELCNSEHIFTIFEWLKTIYNGQNEPSKNEFDLDYAGYLAELKKTGKVNEKQMRDYANNREMKVNLRYRICLLPETVLHTAEFQHSVRSLAKMI